DTATGERLDLSVRHPAPVQAVGFTSGGQNIVTAGGTTALIWNSRTGEQLATFKHEAEITAAMCSSQANIIVTGCADGIAYVWNLEDGKCLAKLDQAGAGL